MVGKQGRMMKEDLYIKNGIVIPGHELEMSVSRSGGPGGQHVNKTNSRVTIRWNVARTVALTDEQKRRVMQQLGSHITGDGDIIVHDSESRSQQQNKESALTHLGEKVRRALYIPKKRMQTAVPKSAKIVRVKEKKQWADIKKMRNKKINIHD